MEKHDLGCAILENLSLQCDCERGQLVSTIQKYEARMLRMSTCAGEFARDAYKAQQGAGKLPQDERSLLQEILKDPCFSHLHLPLKEKIKLAQRAASVPAEAVQPVVFNEERFAYMLNRLSLANRREGWTTNDPWKDREQLKRASDAVVFAEKEIRDYIVSLLATPTPAATVPQDIGRDVALSDQQIGEIWHEAQSHGKNGYLSYARAILAANLTQTAPGKVACTQLLNFLWQNGWISRNNAEHFNTRFGAGKIQ